MKNINSIDSFGSIDADNDSILLDAFEEHEAFIDAIIFKKFLIIGKKGSGKTAIFKKIITQKSHTIFTYGHTFSDYPWHYHEKQKVIGVPKQDRYLHSWKYLILLTLSKIILNHDNSIPFNDTCLESAGNIEKFIIDTYGSRDIDVTQIFTPSKVLKLNPSFGINWGALKGEIKPGLLPIEYLPTVIQNVNKTLSEIIMKTLNPENKYYLTFDELDLGFDPKSVDYKERLTGLILASRNINLLSRKNNLSLNVIVFLRDDIYNLLHFEDKNKITSNHVSYIEWDTERTSHTLKKIMENRFTALLKDDDDELVKWDNVFDETKKMTGRQEKYQHIIDRTFLRPRDIIQFCNEILRTYKEKASPESKFNNEDINKSKNLYSRYFIDELDDEIHKHLPEYEKYFDVFRDIGFLQFEKKDFIEVFEKRKSQFTISDPNDLLKFLFEFSIIGFYRVGGGGYGGSEYSYKYKDVKATFDIQAEKLRIHPALMEYLQLKKYSKSTTS
ncbi:MAG: hypothetical protein LWX08_15320 [Deltaproteobacteria bacterium]|jgi:hypothetical protein|nr:hypothetical protein [Deltaproteobacteria bacterium]